MRIALMTNNYKPIMGGVPISIERLAKGLEALGHQVTVFAPTYKEQEEEENVFRYATLLNRFVGGIVLPNPFDGRIEREFREHRYDVIHVHHPMLIGRTAVYLSRRYQIPLVFTYHTRYEQYLECYTKGIGNPSAYMPLYLKSFLKHCDYVFAPTEGMKHYLTKVCDQRESKIGILPTGIEERHFRVSNESADEIRRKYHAENIPLLLTVSRMASEKNVSFLLRSLVKVKKRYGKPFRMLFVGDGPDKAALVNLSKDLGLQEEVVFTGTVSNEEIAPYFQAADGFLFASKTETQGIVVLEAFAGGTPVIALNATGVEDLVQNSVNGMLTCGDEDAYADNVLCFLQHAEGADEAYQNMSLNAYRTALQYRQEAVALRAVHYYNNLVAAKAANYKKDYVWETLGDGTKVSYFGS